MSRKLVYSSIIFTLIAITACASAPVQEMSDARQAIRAAEDAGAAVYAPQRLRQARQLLERAQILLEETAYGDAKRVALDARDEAIRAREVANAKSSE